MTRLLAVLVTIVALLAGAVSAQGPGGTIALFSDPAGTDCNIVVPDNGFINVYAFHIWHQGAKAVQFSAPIPACFQVIHLGTIPAFQMTLGNLVSGISISYQQCLTGAVYLSRSDFYEVGLTEPCCRYPVLPDPHAPSGDIVVVDCVDNKITGTGGRAIVNPDASCPCTYPVPVKETTWGAIKAQYD